MCVTEIIQINDLWINRNCRKYLNLLSKFFEIAQLILEQ